MSSFLLLVILLGICGKEGIKYDASQQEMLVDQSSCLTLCAQLEHVIISTYTNNRLVASFQESPLDVQLARFMFFLSTTQKN